MLHTPPYFAYWTLDELSERVTEVQSTLVRIEDALTCSTIIDPKRRYSLAEAAQYLGVSGRTLRRRADERLFRIIHDGKRPFVSGAEFLRYARNPGGAL